MRRDQFGVRRSSAAFTVARNFLLDQRSSKTSGELIHEKLDTRNTRKNLPAGEKQLHHLSHATGRSPQRPREILRSSHPRRPPGRALSDVSRLKERFGNQQTLRLQNRSNVIVSCDSDFSGVLRHQIEANKRIDVAVEHAFFPDN